MQTRSLLRAFTLILCALPSSAGTVKSASAGPLHTLTVDISSLGLDSTTLHGVQSQCWQGTGFSGGDVTGKLTPLKIVAIDALTTSSITIHVGNDSQAFLNLVCAVSGGSGGGVDLSGVPTDAVLTKTSGVVAGDTKFTWDPVTNKLRMISGASDGYLVEFKAGVYENDGVYNGTPADHTAGTIAVDPTHGGVIFDGYTDGSWNGMLFEVYPSGTMDITKPVFYFTALAADAFIGKTLWAVDNDFKHDGPGGHYSLQLFEKHGLVASGFPDSVGFFGINTLTPDAVLHVLNPTTDVDDAPKNYVVSLIEGRTDQVADLMQWKKAGGSTLSKVTKDGALQLLTTASQPGCASGTRGTFWITQSGAGVKDKVEVCAKDAADAYAWRTIY